MRIFKALLKVFVLLHDNWTNEQNITKSIWAIDNFCLYHDVMNMASRSNL